MRAPREVRSKATGVRPCDESGYAVGDLVPLGFINCMEYMKLVAEPKPLAEVPVAD